MSQKSRRIAINVRAIALRLVIAAAAASAATSAAQGFPDRPVKISAPYSAGAAPAIFTRVIADKLAKAWGQPVIVEPRPGASGFVALEAVRKATPDGHELVVVSNAHVAINPSLYKQLPYDPDKDFIPVAMLYRTPFFLVVSSTGPYATVPALIAAAKAAPESVSYGSSYVGSPSHLGSAEFEYLTGTKMVHVPYKDQSQMYVAIANGDVGWAFSTLGSALPLVTSGRLKLVAVAAKERVPERPDVPTLTQAGGPEMVVDSWLAVMAPRGTPPQVVQKINAAINAALADADVRQNLRTLGFEAAPGTPQVARRLHPRGSASLRRARQAHGRDRRLAAQRTGLRDGRMVFPRPLDDRRAQLVAQTLGFLAAERAQLAGIAAGGGQHLELQAGALLEEARRHRRGPNVRGDRRDAVPAHHHGDTVAQCLGKRVAERTRPDQPDGVVFGDTLDESGRPGCARSDAVRRSASGTRRRADARGRRHRRPDALRRCAHESTARCSACRGPQARCRRCRARATRFRSRIPASVATETGMSASPECAH